MDRTYFIHNDFPGRSSPLALAVPSADIPGADLLQCVKDSLALHPEMRVYFTYEPPTQAVVPLCASLPDGTKLRLHEVAEANPSEISDSDSVRELKEENEAKERRRWMLQYPGCCCFFERKLPERAVMNNDLANERTLLAWCRTALAIMRTVFSYLTAKALGAMPIHAAVLLGIERIILALGFAILVPLFFVVGWQRFRVMRKMLEHGSRRRIAIAPLVLALSLAALVNVVGVGFEIYADTYHLVGISNDTSTFNKLSASKGS